MYRIFRHGTKKGCVWWDWRKNNFVRPEFSAGLPTARGSSACLVKIPYRAGRGLPSVSLKYRIRTLVRNVERINLLYTIHNRGNDKINRANGFLPHPNAVFSFVWFRIIDNLIFSACGKTIPMPWVVFYCAWGKNKEKNKNMRCNMSDEQTAWNEACLLYTSDAADD